MNIHSKSAPIAPGLWREEDLWPRREEPDVRTEIANRFMPFAKSIALRYTSTAEPTDDLIQVASVGLMNAIKRYDPDSGHPFVAFASPTIHGELKRHFRDRVSGLRLPRGVYERVGRIEIVISNLRGELGREPTTTEIAESMQISELEVEEAREAVDSRHPKPLKRDEDGDEAGGLEEHLGIVDQGFDLAEERIAVSEALSQLDAEDRTIILLRFWDELSQSEIADRVGCSQMQISRKLRQILDRLNELVGAPEAGQVTAGSGAIGQ